MSQTEQTTAAPEKVKLTVSGILADLDNGLDRKAIKAKYGLSTTDVSRLFQNEKLKGVRVKKAPAFELEDDVPDAPGAVTKKVKATKAQPVKEEAAAPTVATATAAPVTEEEKEEEIAETAVADVTSGSPIKEVKSADDGDDAAKGLW